MEHHSPKLVEIIDHLDVSLTSLGETTHRNELEVAQLLLEIADLKARVTALEP